MPEGLLTNHGICNDSHTQVKLIPHDSEHCLFRILPRYKVRSVGDEVMHSHSI